MANFKTEREMLEFLKDSDFSKVLPKVIEYDKVEDKDYLVITKKEGKRLSEIFKRIRAYFREDT